MTTLELLTPAEQKAILVVAEYLMSQRTGGQKSGVEALLEELHLVEPRFTALDEGLSPERLAALRFMPENPVLMQLLAHSAGAT